MDPTPLEKALLSFAPPLPLLLKKLTSLKVEERKEAFYEKEEIKGLFPRTFGQPLVHFSQGGEERKAKKLKVGVIFSGGQASGGHNVISGLYDALGKLTDEPTLIGFLNGPQGIIDNAHKQLDKELLSSYRNAGGFDLIGSGRTKIETKEQLAASLDTCKKQNLDGLVIIGGDDSNTNAAVLAEYFLANGCRTKVIGVPKTIDGDLKNAYIETSFGFDTACKIYSELIGNICRDALSARKYYHFIKLMGRSASHIALECALQTHPNFTIIGEEVAAQKKTLLQITHELTELIAKRAAQGKNYGVILIPEGLIEFIPEVNALISELNPLLIKHTKEIDDLGGVEKKKAFLSPLLSESSKATFSLFPEEIAGDLLLDRDPHGNIQVSHIATEKLLIHAIKQELSKKGTYKGKFNPVSHFFGYEGRCGFPSFFDASYCYALGTTAALLISCGLTGYISTLAYLNDDVEHWEPRGIPLTLLLDMEMRKGKSVPVIKKSLVDLSKDPFTAFAKSRAVWEIEDLYRYPGPIQFFGPKELVEQKTFTLNLEGDKERALPHFVK